MATADEINEAISRPITNDMYDEGLIKILS